MNCKKCKSTRVEIDKWVFGTSEKPIFHYKLTCKDCKKNYNVKRNKWAFIRVKNKQWKYSKQYLKTKLYGKFK